MADATAQSESPKSESRNPNSDAFGPATADQLVGSAFPGFGFRLRTHSATRCASRSSQRAGFALACATVVSSVSACACVKHPLAPALALTMPAKPMQGIFNSAAAPRDLAHALAHQRRAINRSFPGDHQIRRAQTSLQRRLPRKQIKPRLQLRPQKCHATQSPARLRRRRPARARSRARTAAGRPAPTGPGNARPARNPAGASPFCGP